MSETEELFGSIRPENLPTMESDKPKRKKKKQSDFSKLTRDYWENLGYWVVRCEKWQIVGHAMRSDLMGLWDYMLCKPNQPPEFLQVCARSAKAAHMKKLRDDSCRVYDTGESRAVNARKCFEYGFKCYLQLWDQEAPRKPWRSQVIQIQKADLVD